jgi:hypothetical protein
VNKLKKVLESTKKNEAKDKDLLGAIVQAIADSGYVIVDASKVGPSMGKMVHAWLSDGAIEKAT